MLYTEAFRKLGYELDSPRQDWSAENNSGVCITLWRVEIKVQSRLPWIDSRLHCGPLEAWQGKSGNNKRISHLQRAVDELSGRVDVVVVHGNPGVSYGDADPWDVLARGGYWQIGDFDRATGHFSAKVVPSVGVLK